MSDGATAVTERPRRDRWELTLVVVACAVAAGLAFYAASRPWVVQVSARPAPLPPLSQARTGAAVVPMLPALALVALAGAGALLATRGAARAALGAGLAACGAGIMVAVFWAFGTVEGVGTAGPTLAMAAGGALSAVGAFTARRGRSWPAMGARYERARGPASDHPAAVTTRAPAARDVQLWDAIDRGEDPTRD